MTGRPSVIRHLLRAMHVGDVIYLPEHRTRLDKQIKSCGVFDAMRFKTSCFVAVNLNPANAHRIVRIERVQYPPLPKGVTS